MFFFKEIQFYSLEIFSHAFDLSRAVLRTSATVKAQELVQKKKLSS